MKNNVLPSCTFVIWVNESFVHTTRHADTKCIVNLQLRTPTFCHHAVLILELLQLIKCVKQTKILPLKAKALDLIIKWRPTLQFFAPEMYKRQGPLNKRHGNFVHKTFSQGKVHKIWTPV